MNGSDDAAHGRHHLLLIGGAGYIGSYLLQRLVADGYHVDVCDDGRRGYPLGPVRYGCAYADLTDRTLGQYSHVLWFAGVPSVRLAMQDPLAALENNCVHLYQLARRIRRGTRFVYASTGSLYSSAPGSDDRTLCDEAQPILPGGNAYDVGKFAFDYIASGFLTDYIGLRMGTVSGFSPNLRPELIFNAMNVSAASRGVVEVSNPAAKRSLLFLTDLYRTVRKCVDLERCPNGFFNIASLNSTIGAIADEIAAHHGAMVRYVDGPATYSFAMSTERAKTTLGVQFDAILSRQCDDFCAAWAGLDSQRRDRRNRVPRVRFTAVDAGTRHGGAGSR